MGWLTPSKERQARCGTFGYGVMLIYAWAWQRANLSSLWAFLSVCMLLVTTVEFVAILVVIKSKSINTPYYPPLSEEMLGKLIVRRKRFRFARPVLLGLWIYSWWFLVD